MIERKVSQAIQELILIFAQGFSFSLVDLLVGP